MSPNEELYGEVGAHLVDPALVSAAGDTLSFCLKNYGLRPGYERPRIRWLALGGAYHALAKMEEAVKKFFSKSEPDILERGYLKSDEQIHGCVPSRWTRGGQPGLTIFISCSAPLEKIRRVVGHEFFHWRFSGPAIRLDQVEADEKAANEFGKRIEAEIGGSPDDEERREKLRQVYRNQSR